MKLISYILFLGILVFNNSTLKGINVSVSSLLFYGESPYIEIYSRVESGTVQYSSPEDALEALSAEIEYLILIERDNRVYIADKYIIKSPETKELADFWDLKRYKLDAGQYTLKLRYVDVNNIQDTFQYEEKLDVKSPDMGYIHSDILLTAGVDTSNSKYSFEKAGFYFEPLSFNLLNTDQNKLIFYIELHNTDQLSQDPFFVKYFIEAQDHNDINMVSHVGYKKLQPSKKDALLVELDLSNLGTGNYKLALELNTKEKYVLDIIEERFSIYHPIIDIKSSVEKDALYETSFVQFLRDDDLNYSLKAIQPKVGNNISEALNYVVANDDLPSKRYFLYNFWSQISKTDMKAHYDKYMEVVRAVDREFSNNVGFGFETDRGYFFLKYGRPSDIVVVEDEPSAPPYEIWIYNYMPSTQQTNVKFLFYNPTLVTNDFVLLHSTCRGERSNPRWEVDLYSDAVNESNEHYLDARTMPDNWNRNARRYFTDF